MTRVTIYLLVAVVFCQTISVFTRQVDLDDFNTNNANAQSSTPSSASTTTTASPQLTRCLGNCPTLPQYNPICGTDGVSYTNPGRLACAQECGLNVQQAHVGTCGPSPGGK